jgi:hypothetical protein
MYGLSGMTTDSFYAACLAFDTSILGRLISH